MRVTPSLAERWRESESSAARYAALNQLDFALGGIFEVAYEDTELDEWMQDGVPTRVLGALAEFNNCFGSVSTSRWPEDR